MKIPTINIRPKKIKTIALEHAKRRKNFERLKTTKTGQARLKDLENMYDQ